MPTIEVYNGNLEAALATFKGKCYEARIFGDYKDSLRFAPKNQQRRLKAHLQEKKRAAKSRRRGE